MTAPAGREPGVYKLSVRVPSPWWQIDCFTAVATAMGYYFTNFDPFNPPKPPAPEKKEAPKPAPPPPPPPRMLILVGGGSECMVALPAKFDAAVAVAQDKFAVPPSHWVRLAVNRSDVPSWLARYAEGELVYM